jgi:hypothetical protein
VRARSFSLFLVSLLVVNALGTELSANGQPLPTFPGMELYNPSRIVGKQGVRWNAEAGGAPPDRMFRTIKRRERPL